MNDKRFCREGAPRTDPLKSGPQAIYRECMSPWGHQIPGNPARVMVAIFSVLTEPQQLRVLAQLGWKEVPESNDKPNQDD